MAKFTSTWGLKMQTRFNYTKMRRTFYEWHGGQSSPLYAAASSGIVENIGMLQSELELCAASIWDDKKENAFTHNRSLYIRAHKYAEWQYLRAVSDALPNIIKNGKLPWGAK